MKSKKLIKVIFVPVFILWFLILFRFWGLNFSSSYYLFKGYSQMKQKIEKPVIIENNLVKSISDYKCFSRSYFYLGYHYLKESDYGKASAIFKKGMELNVDPAYMYNYAVLLKRMNKMAECYKTLTKSIEIFPLYFKNYRLLLNLDGSLKFDREDYKQRVKQLWKLRKINGELDTAANRNIISGILNDKTNK